jgi:hypothetical protein
MFVVCCFDIFSHSHVLGTYTVLGYAVCFNKADAVKIILENGADPELEFIVSKATRTPLSVAKVEIFFLYVVFLCLLVV